MLSRQNVEESFDIKRQEFAEIVAHAPPPTEFLLVNWDIEERELRSG